ncbi:MAG: serine/threonine-protein kinase, partial [Vicinamibacterales bacterium]|nr:serine/threonine-protein kinase [Vicinamibacterales bacterium]
KTIASLNHPHICTLHDVGQHGDSIYLVMEHLAGETLADRLLKGRLPLDQALGVATEIADALTAAHRQGIIHRDLKPGNVMLTKAGAKLLDFGLAKLKGHAAGPAAGQLTSLPTRTAPLTAEGTIVGTLQYMAPEQVEGKSADARTDLWALGAILYEMLTGKRAFEGSSAASLVAAILDHEPPPVASLQPLTPPALERLVRRCLAKSPDDRPDTAHDVADELRWIAQGSAPMLELPAVRPRRRVWLTRTVWALTLAGVAAAGVIVGQRFERPGSGRPRGEAARKVAHLDLMLPSDAPFWVDPRGLSTSFALSPDGSVMAYTCARDGATEICLRRLDRSEVSRVAGTEGGRHPVFSPDGQRVLFCVASGQTCCDAGAPLRQLLVLDGRVDTLSTTPADSGCMNSLAWPTDDMILLSGYGGIWQVLASGGPARRVVRTDAARGEISFAFPALLPGGRRMVAAAARLEQGRYVGELRVVTVETGEQHVLLRDATLPRYLATGHLLYAQGAADSLMVAPFDAARLVLGPPVPLSEPIRSLNGPAYSVALNGTLLYLPIDQDRVLTWVDRQQRSVPALPLRAPWQAVQLSPDGRRVAVEVAREQGRPSIEVVDLDRGSPTPVVPSGNGPLWTPDGTRITFGSPGYDSILWQPADGSGTAEVLHRAGFAVDDGSWSPDGRVLAFTGIGQSAERQIWVVSQEGGKWAPRRFLPVPGSSAPGGCAPRFSPDGRWIAYTSSQESGAYEVWVRAYPGGGQRTQVSVGGGHDAAWSPDARELFYRDGDRFYAVPVTLAPTFSAGRPRLLFTGPYLDRGVYSAPVYGVTRDGQRFLVVQVGDEERAPRRFHLVQNWFEELRAKVPAGGAK